MDEEDGTEYYEANEENVDIDLPSGQRVTWNLDKNHTVGQEIEKIMREQNIPAGGEMELRLSLDEGRKIVILRSPDGIRDKHEDIIAASNIRMQPSGDVSTPNPSLASLGCNIRKQRH